VVLCSAVDGAAQEETADVQIAAEQQRSAPGLDITRILVEARAADATLQFSWNLPGVEGVAGDAPTASEHAPESLAFTPAQVIVSVTISDQQGRRISKNVTLDVGVQALSDTSQEEQAMPKAQPTAAVIPGLTLLPVPAGSYTMSAYLQRYIRYLDVEAVDIETPFSIQAGEVTVSDFRRYVASLPPAQQDRLGRQWEQNADGTPYPDEQPVEHVSWQDASAYAAWLSQVTGWDLRLPTVEQWAAACARYAERRPVLITQTNRPLTELQGAIDHLLGNLREWSATACDAGTYRIVGENYMTDTLDPDMIGQGYCLGQDEHWSGVGFRLIKIEQ